MTGKLPSVTGNGPSHDKQGVNMADTEINRANRKTDKRNRNSTNAETPYWLGNYPFKAKEKRPCLLKKTEGLPRTYGVEPNDIHVCLHVSTDKITCSEFHVCPGKFFDPPDIHSGDEAYYISKGTATVLNPDDGSVHIAEEGDFVLIPEGVWHQAFNFSADKLEVLTMFGKDMLAFDHDWPNIRYPGDPSHFKGTQSEIASRLKALNPQRAGQKQLHQHGSIEVIKSGEGLNTIRAEEGLSLISFYISNETLHAGIIIIPPRGRSDLHSHNGDEVIYCLNESIAVRIVAEKETINPSAPDRYIVNCSDRFFIPKGVEHQYTNYSDKAIKLVFCMAPDL